MQQRHKCVAVERHRPPSLDAPSEDARRLRDLLRVTLLAGGYPGGVLPSEAMTMVEHGLSRHAVREALGLLQGEGLLRRVRGTGTLVQARKDPHPFDRMHGILEGAGDLPIRVDNQILMVRGIRATAPLVQLLGVDGGSALTMVEYLARLDGEAFLHGTSYLADPRAAGVAEGDFSVDFYGLLESIGICLGRSRLAVESVVADGASSQLLDLAPGAPVIRFERTLFDPLGTPVEFGFLYCRADRVALVLELPRTAHERP